MDTKTVKNTRNGCGNCYWWNSLKLGWGKCKLHGIKMWYNCMTCPEYEADSEAPEYITIPTED